MKRFHRGFGGLHLLARAVLALLALLDFVGKQFFARGGVGGRVAEGLQKLLEVVGAFRDAIHLLPRLRQRFHGVADALFLFLAALLALHVILRKARDAAADCAEQRGFAVAKGEALR